MKKLLQPVLAAGLVLTAASAPVLVAPAAAQDARGVGVVNITAVVLNSNAYKTAETQRQTTYKAQIDQAQARQQQLAAQIQPLADAFNAARQGTNPDQASLQQQLAQIQQIQQAGQAELQEILAPIALSRAYVTEQIEERLDAAVQAAARKNNVTLVLDAGSGQVLYADAAHNLNQAVLDELNAALPSAQLVPPQGWLPRELREQQAAAQAAQQPAPQTQPAQPTGR